MAPAAVVFDFAQRFCGDGVRRQQGGGIAQQSGQPCQVERQGPFIFLKTHPLTEQLIPAVSTERRQLILLQQPVDKLTPDGQLFCFFQLTIKFIFAVQRFFAQFRLGEHKLIQTQTIAHHDDPQVERHAVNRERQRMLFGVCQPVKTLCADHLL